MLLDGDSLEFIEKSLTRADAKKVHKDLPEGGQWRTMNGHHIYIVNGKIVAGTVPGVTKAKKMTKATMAEHQAKIDAKEKKTSAKKKPTATKKASASAKPKSGGSTKGQGSKKATAGKTTTAANKSRVKPVIDPSKKTVEHYELYHGTKLPNVEGIKRDGFKPNGSSADFGDAVYFKSPSFDALDHDDQQKKIEKFKQSNFSKDAINRMEKHRGNDTTNIVHGFAGKEAAVIHAVIPKKHVLDLTKGRPKELQDLIDSWHSPKTPTERMRLAFKYVLGEDTEGKSDEQVTREFDARKDEFKKATGKKLFMMRNLSPYELYAKKYGIGAIVDKLDEYDDEGWQIGVYDSKIIQIKDTGKGIQWDDKAKAPKLIKALIKSLRKQAVPYCLLHHHMDDEGLHMHIGATGGKSE